MEQERRKSLTEEVERKASIVQLKDTRRRMSQVKSEDKKFYGPLGPEATQYLMSRHVYVKALNYPTKFLRKMQLGIECPTYMEWRHWYPGQEYRKTFVIKNVGRRTLTFQWKPPASPFFIMEFKEPARLSSGTSASMDIVFKPSQLVNFQSAVEFVTAKWKWSLVLKGSLPNIDLGFPTAFDFGYCTVKEYTDKKYEVRNDGDIPVAYQWTVKPPFFMIPEAGTILPGDTESLVCRFKPQDASAYISKAFVTTTVGSTTDVRMTGIGKFPVLALLPYALPFGHVLVHSSKEMQLVVTNTSIVPAKFWVARAAAARCGEEEEEDDLGVASVFTIDPTEGVIGPTSCITLKVRYTPVSAGTFSTEDFEISVNTTSRVSFSCSGTAARPLVSISSFSMDFGSLELGDSVARAITLTNHSDIAVNFQFAPEGMTVFQLVTDRGSIASKRATTVTIHFKPMEARNYYQRVFCLVQDNYPLYCDFIGTCFRETLRQPTLMQYHVDQHRAYVKTAIAHQVAAMQMEEDVFVERRHAPKKARPVARVCWGEFCSLGRTDLINVGSSILMPHIKRVDVTESDGQKQVKVALELERKSTISYRDTAPRCSNVYVQNILDPTGRTRQNSYVLTDEMPGPGDFADIDTNVVLGNNKALVLKHKQVHLGKEESAREVWEEVFLGRMVDWEPVSMDVAHIDFGAVQCGHMSEVRHISVTNNCDTLVTCLWLLETAPGEVPPRLKLEPVKKVYGGGGGGGEQTRKEAVFQVHPRRADVPVGAKFTFGATFQPAHANDYYSQLMTMLVYDNCDVGAKACAISPPWSAGVQACGHSFPPLAPFDRQQGFVPLGVAFQPVELIFRPVLIKHPVYQTTTLYNAAKTPLKFAFKCEELVAEIGVRPSEGVVPGESHQLITFRFEATEAKVFRNKVTCIFNNAARDCLVLHLTASTHLPKLVVEKEASALCFQATSVGTRVIQTLVMVNKSGISSQYRWDIPAKYKDIFAIEQASGVIRGKERIYLNCSFSPAKSKHYTCHVRCLTSACTEKAFYSNNAVALQAMPSSEYLDHLTLVAHGEGVVDSIRIRPELLDVGILVVGVECKKSVSLYNPSQGGLQYQLLLKSSPGQGACIIFDAPSGFIPARSFHPVTVTLKAMEATSFAVEVMCRATFPDSYELIPPVPGIPSVQRNEAVEPEAVELESLFCICALAEYPGLQVVAVKSEEMSGEEAWREVGAERLNHILATDKVKEKSLFCLGATLAGMTPFLLDLGCARWTCAPTTTLQLAVKCLGGLAASWKVRIWNDREADTENWVREGEPEEEESLFLSANSHSLFQVEPRQGHLQPGDHVAYIKLSYRRRQGVEGKHVLPLLLDVKDGRTTPINLLGTTLRDPPAVWSWDAQKSYPPLLSPQARHLRPVPVGHPNPPWQTLDFRNRADHDVCYHLDLAPLEDMEKADWGFPVLTCLNPAGSIPAKDFILLNFCFRPLEAKEYSLRIPVMVEGGDGGLLSLTALGYDANLPPPPVQPQQDAHVHWNWPGDAATLSTQTIHYGVMEELSWNRRLVAVKNLLPADSIAFFWHNNMATEAMVYGDLSVVPSYGVLEPGHSCVCNVIFGAGVRPQIFHTTLRCEIQIIPPPVAEAVEEQEDAAYEEIIADNWNRLGSNSRTNNAKARRSRTRSRPRINPLPPIQLREDGPDADADKTSATLFLTVAGEIFKKHDYHTTPREAPANVTADAPEQTPLHIRHELVSTCLLQLLQESLETEMLDPTFDNIDPHLHLFYQELKSHTQFDTTNSTQHPTTDSNHLQHQPLPPQLLHPSFSNPNENDDDDTSQRTHSGALIAQHLLSAFHTTTSPPPLDAPTPIANLGFPPTSRLETMEMVDFVLEGTLFNLVKEIYEHDQ